VKASDLQEVRSGVRRVVAACGLEQGNVVKFLAKADRLRPAYCIALRPEHKQAGAPLSLVEA